MWKVVMNEMVKNSNGGSICGCENQSQILLVLFLDEDLVGKVTWGKW